jgi:DNA polymerase-1
MNTAAVFGFTNTLVDLIQREKPTHIAVCFDTAARTSRSDAFEEYKANRQEQPEDITVALPISGKLLKHLKFLLSNWMDMKQMNIIGTLAKKAERDGYKVYMVTPDKDFGQLVSENVLQYKPAYQGRPVEIMGPEEIKKRWEIDDTLKVIDILGLMGDSVDNIPGLPGVGEKTAKKLVTEFGSVENLVEHPERLKGKLQQTVTENKELALLSKKLATIDLHVPIEVEEERLIMEEPDKAELTKLFNELEFRSLAKELLEKTILYLPQESKEIFSGKKKNPVPRLLRKKKLRR